MQADQFETLQTLLVAQVLTLAQTIEAAKALKGSTSSDHYVPEAVRLVAAQRAQILARLAQSP